MEGRLVGVGVLLIYLYTFHLLWFLEVLLTLGCCPCVSPMHLAVWRYWLLLVNDLLGRQGFIVQIVIF